MYNALLLAMLVISVLLIIVITMQPTKTNSASSALTGGAEQLFGKQKARGFEAVLQRVTVILGIAFFVIALVLAYVTAQG
ncbi:MULTISPECIES: preprotein translocase subunit SecG [Carnobacterium]|uniref:Protein-export membrane protein SecG n=2 Tax=Carnobacterium maltaromaticum TaxID=2751 RepID=K8E2M5_CARML|nr:preprotein translocase subunit SecG [Carnobacterium maltaromaticum]AOA01311.1 preprotein translocase subunit SecG [Carnobacterium maltaromaticum]MBC9789598.1 preprotein translocase subunit SecG [Carnobacterium maltaromaticum]MBC9808383.1 preprotein translocase subunit SecG [Carnobacterium maltaromaticum]MCC4313126.1 preprotein translocase subunit SecG [Carnobacterium maltaromaticum]MCI1819903.1 preprotein translocase subunit SecG [Carnobacterium maltaromaticum]